MSSFHHRLLSFDRFPQFVRKKTTPAFPPKRDINREVRESVFILSSCFTWHTEDMSMEATSSKEMLGLHADLQQASTLR